MLLDLRLRARDRCRGGQPQALGALDRGFVPVQSSTSRVAAAAAVSRGADGGGGGRVVECLMFEARPSVGEEVRGKKNGKKREKKERTNDGLKMITSHHITQSSQVKPGSVSQYKFTPASRPHVWCCHKEGSFWSLVIGRGAADTLCKAPYGRLSRENDDRQTDRQTKITGCLSVAPITRDESKKIPLYSSSTLETTQHDTAP